MKKPAAALRAMLRAIKNYFSRNKFNLICSAIALLLMWAVWLACCHAVGNPLIVPSFSRTMGSLWRYIQSGSFWRAFGNTSLRTLLAFALSFLLAAACALAALSCRAVRAVLQPFLVVVRVMPTLAVLLIILKVTYGNRSLSPVIVTVLVLFPMMYSSMLAEADGIGDDLKEMAKAYSVPRAKRFFKIYLPPVSSALLARAGADLSLGLKIMISAEVLVSASKGLGGMMQYANLAAETADLFALTVAAVVLGLAAELLFARLARVNDRWAKKEERNA